MKKVCFLAVLFSVTSLKAISPIEINDTNIDNAMSFRASIKGWQDNLNFLNSLARLKPADLADYVLTHYSTEATHEEPIIEHEEPEYKAPEYKEPKPNKEPKQTSSVKTPTELKEWYFESTDTVYTKANEADVIAYLVNLLIKEKSYKTTQQQITTWVQDQLAGKVKIANLRGRALVHFGADLSN